MITGFELPWWVFVGHVLLGLVEVLVIYIMAYWLAVFMTDVTKTDKVLAKVWPFGKWDVTWESSEGETLKRDIPLRKEEAVDWYFRYMESNIALKNVQLIKVGGFLNGIRIKPKHRGRKT